MRTCAVRDSEPRVDRPPSSPTAKRRLDRVTLLGLAALLEIADAAAPAPIAPTLQLKALLSLLFRRSNGDRAPYADFWAVMIEEAPDLYRNGARGSYARTHWTRIVRTLGGRPEPADFDASIRSIAREHAAEHSPATRRAPERRGGR